jgi:hypothetical protein
LLDLFLMIGKAAAAYGGNGRLSAWRCVLRFYRSFVLVDYPPCFFGAIEQALATSAHISPIQITVAHNANELPNLLFQVGYAPLLIQPAK